MTQIIPLNNNVLIKIDKEGEKMESGMIIAHSEGDKTEAVAIKGIVVDVPAKLTIKVKKGDKILAAKWEGQHANVGAEHFLLIKAEHILAILK
jgi:chaperonin GroES